MRTLLLRGVLLAVLASAVWAGAAAAATAPQLVGSLANSTTLSGANAVAVSGNIAYEVSYWSGQLNEIDISHPATAPPAIVGSTPALVPSMTAATNVTIAAGAGGHVYAFVTAKNRNASLTSNDDGSGNSLTIVDVSNPGTVQPTVVGTLPDPVNLFGAYSVALSANGQDAYIASQGVISGDPAAPQPSTGSFSVVDITNPAGPTLVGHIENSTLTGAQTNALDHATSVAISGHYAFVTAFNSQRLTTIDVSTATAPAVVSTLHDTTSFPVPDDVVVSGTHAYVVNQVNPSAPGSGMELASVDISNPLAPTVSATLTDPTLLGAYHVRTRGNFVYVSANDTAAIAAIDISRPGAPRLAGALTDAAHLANVTGLDVSSTGRYIVATSPRLATNARPNQPPYPFQTGGPTVTGTVSVIDLDPTAIGVTLGFKPANPTTTTSATFTFSTSDAVATVQCSLDSAAFAPCTSQTVATYSGLGIGSHTFKVQATDATGATAQASYTWTVTSSPATAPKSSTAPKITGSAQQGKTLSASTGTWSGVPAPSFSYQWQRCHANGSSCTSISNQTKNTYKATVADVGSRLDVLVTAKNSAGSATAKSASTGVVKWSSGKFASATLTHSKTSKLGLKFSVSSVGGVLLQKMVISLPKGLKFKGSRTALAKKLGLKSLAHKTLKFRLSLKHGHLTIILTKPSTGVTLTLPRGYVVKGKSAKLGSVKLKVSLSYAGKPVRSGSVSLRLG